MKERNYKVIEIKVSLNEWRENFSQTMVEMAENTTLVAIAAKQNEVAGGGYDGREQANL